MKFNLLICVILVLILLFSCTKQSTETSQNTTETAAQESSQETHQEETITDALGNILKLGGKYKCAVTSQDIKSVIYVDRENSRSETILPSGGVSYSIAKKMPNGKVCISSWLVGVDVPQNQVIKMCITQEETPINPTNTQAPSNDVEVKCSKYFGTVDLESPANLEVLDLSNLQTGGAGSVVAVVPLDN